MGQTGISQENLPKDPGLHGFTIFPIISLSTKHCRLNTDNDSLMRIAPVISYPHTLFRPPIAPAVVRPVCLSQPSLSQKSVLVGSGQTFLSLAFLLLNSRPQAKVVCLHQDDYAHLFRHGFRARILKKIPKPSPGAPLFLCFEGQMALIDFFDGNTLPKNTPVFGWNTGKTPDDRNIIDRLFRERQVKGIRIGNMLTHFETTLTPNRNAFSLLNRFLEKFDQPQKGVILLEPDPDSIASALAIREILKAKNQDITLFATFKPSRPENKELLRYLQRNLNFRIAYANGVDFFGENHFDYGILVDANPSNDKVFKFFPQHLELRAAFDHHPLGRPINFGKDHPHTFFDIRYHYGACASMLTEYLRAQDLDFRKIRSLATALYYGIITDTQGLKAARYRQVDRESLHFLSEFIDRPMLDNIQKRKIQFVHRHYLAEAYRNLREVPGKDDFAFTYVGDVGPHHEILATVAEQILFTLGKPYVAVAGIHDDGEEKVLDISTRGMDKTFKWNFFLRRHFAGFGHPDMARGAKPIREIPGLGSEDLSTDTIMAYLQELFGKISS